MKFKKHICAIFCCPDCGKKFHMKKCYDNHVEEKKCQGKYNCTYCTERFTTKHNLYEHISSTHGFRCTKPYCDFVCGNARNLTLHLRRHAKSIACELCGQYFGAYNSLSRHKLRKHDIGRSVSCKECGKKFPGNYELERHMTLHTGAKPFKCSMCPMSFTQKHVCVRHEEKHRQELAQS
eukprot:TRINITY_DN6246_c0_g1_i6.p1 TRINITY_DN6246_c0_g1~~TRINITY_DN6246_c0_g1_i6.p1  ORF type:complete len:208 (+),score=6.16 TRINITY_DN6246_c0_g1_i6:89-625(+)